MRLCVRVEDISNVRLLFVKVSSGEILGDGERTVTEGVIVAVPVVVNDGVGFVAVCSASTVVNTVSTNTQKAAAMRKRPRHGIAAVRGTYAVLFYLSLYVC